MLMSRRAPPSWREIIRLSLWPRRSWTRSFRYASLRLGRVRTLPRKLALGAAAGVFVAVLPIPGLQLAAAAALAWLVRGHHGAALLATFAANPVTYPLIWLASYVVGATILGTPLSNATHDIDSISDLMAQSLYASGPATPSLMTAIRAVLPAMTTLAVGAVPLAAAAAAMAYLAVRHLLRRRDRPHPHAQRTVAAWPQHHVKAVRAAVSAVVWWRLAGGPLDVAAAFDQLPFWGSGQDA